MLKKIKKGLFILAAWLLFFVALAIVLEISFLNFFVRQSPVSHHGILGMQGYPLMQYSKKGLIPEDYIAILGDSYAYGSGEWMFRVYYEVGPDYQPSHLLHKNLEKDVVSFGLPGAGSIRALVTTPQTFINSINNSYFHSIEDPELFVVYFFEGNDLKDNLSDIEQRFIKRGYDKERIFDENYFQDFLFNEAVFNDKFYQLSQSGSPWERFYLGRYLSLSLYDFLFREHSDKTLAEEMGEWESIEQNQVKIKGEVKRLGSKVLGPGLVLTEEEIDLGVYVFEQSVKYLQRQFPNTPIGLVYIPSVVSSYEWESSKAEVEDKDGNETLISTAKASARSNLVCKKVQQVSMDNNVSFIDARPAIRETSSQELVHHPVDWQHFSEAGYRTLALVTEDLIKSMNAEREISGECRRL